MTKQEIKKHLLAGMTLRWQNLEEYAEIEATYGETLSGGKTFNLYFNGAFVSITKGFEPMLKKLETLKNKHGMHNFDYFEHWELIPEEVSAILSPLEDMAGYAELDEALKQIEPLGWTFEYGLDAVAYNLKKIAPQA